MEKDKGLVGGSKTLTFYAVDDFMGRINLVTIKAEDRGGKLLYFKEAYRAAKYTRRRSKEDFLNNKLVKSTVAEAIEAFVTNKRQHLLVAKNLVDSRNEELNAALKFQQESIR